MGPGIVFIRQINQMMKFIFLQTTRKSIILYLAVILWRTHPLKVITVWCANNTAVAFFALSCAVRMLGNRRTTPQKLFSVKKLAFS